jgi:hypothetical protein
MPTLYSGIDIAPAPFTAAVWQHGRARLLGQFANTPAGCATSAAQVQAVQGALADSHLHLVLEPTGGYEEALVAFGHRPGARPTPHQRRDWAERLGYRAKTESPLRAC